MADENRDGVDDDLQDLEDIKDIDDLPDIRIYSHSPLFYWWPAWVLGYIFAIVTAVGGEDVGIGSNNYWVHPNKAIGVTYTAVLLIVILFTNITLRGLWSVVTIMFVAIVCVTLAWLGLWDDVVDLIPILGIHMNLGFFVTFSTVLFVIWALAFFVFDRVTFWRVRPGQMTYERVVGGGEKSYDTRGMVFEKHLEDFFKHIILGIGMGDLKIMTSGARSEEIYVPNVFMVDRKVTAIQKLISVQPDDMLKEHHHHD